MGVGVGVGVGVGWVVVVVVRVGVCGGAWVMVGGLRGCRRRVCVCCGGAGFGRAISWRMPASVPRSRFRSGFCRGGGDGCWGRLMSWFGLSLVVWLLVGSGFVLV